MSPEQARNAKSVTERTDVWSLSVVLWEMLSGQRLWAGRHALAELIVALVNEPVARLERTAPWVPRDLALAVHRGLERDPEKRTPSMKALIAELELFAGNSDRLVASQLHGLSEAERSELALKAQLPTHPSRRPVDVVPRSAKQRPAEEIGVSSTIRGSAHERTVAPSRTRSSHLTTIAVALISAAIAGGAAFYFARSRGGPSTPTEAPPPPSPARPITAKIQISPPDALVLTPDGPAAVVSGEVTLRGNAGQNVSVTVQRGSVTKTFTVSLGSDGIASPSRLVLPP
jgi:serine/threonine-protein kinase